MKSGLLFLATLLFMNAGFAQKVKDGKDFLYYERFESAKNVFEKILAVEPNNEEAIYGLGQAFIGLENVPAAKKLYLEKLQANPNSPLVMAGVGHVELIENKKEDARNHFETAISLSKGKSIDVLNAVGYANSNINSVNGDAAYAIQKLKQATEIKKFNDPEVYANLGDAYRKFADGGNAILSYQAALAINPKYARAIYRSGRVYQTQGRTQEPIYMKYYNDAIAADPNYGPVYETLFNYYFETDVTRSAEYLDKWLNNSDDDPKACYSRASMKYAQGLFNEAILKADECIGSTETGGTAYPSLYGLKALAYNKLGDSLKARDFYEEYFTRQSIDKIGPGDYASYATLLLKFPGNEDKAAELITKAVNLDTLEENKVAYLSSIANAYQDKKNYLAAGNWFNKIMDVKKNFNNVDLFNAGYAYYNGSQYDSSIKVFTRYTEKYPEDLFGYYMLGNSYSSLDTTGMLGLAVPYYQKVIEIGEADPTKPNTNTRLLVAYKYFMGYSFNVLKDQAASLAYADKALAIDPTDANVIQSREFISKNKPSGPPPAPKNTNDSGTTKKPANQR